MPTSRLRSSNQREHGFTLIEMMIVVALIGILASIALPAYNDYVRRGVLPEAFTTLTDYRNKLEQYFLDNKNYGSNGTCATDASANSWNAFPKNGKYFQLNCTLTAAGYTLTADGISGQAIGHTYTLDQDNIKSTTQFKGDDYSGNRCWFTKAASCD